MIIKVNKKIGENSQLSIEVEEKSERDALARATFYLTPDVCLFKKEDGTFCGSTFIQWQSNQAKTDDGTFTYVKRKCNKCGATSTAGEYKGGGLFWKTWEKFEKGGEKSEEHLADNIPF